MDSLKTLELLRKIDNGYKPNKKETKQLTNLQYLNLNNSQLTTLPESVGQLTNLKKLYLWNTQITTLPESIGQLTNLQYLSLNNSQLTTLPESVGQLTNLQYLSLNNSQLTTLPESVGQLTNLKELYLRNTQITTLPESIGQLTNLQTLRLNAAQITTLPESIGQLTSLQELNLSNTQLTTLPESIGQLTNLKELYLRNTQITTMPESVGQLTSLQTLYLGNTQITTLPESVGELTNLQTLWLDDTQITTLPESIGQLTNLQYLYLDDSQLTTLPESVGQLTNLKELYLRYTQITTLPESIGQLTNLKTLRLDATQITTLPESVGQLTSLQELYLSNTQLTTLPDCFDSFTELIALDLSDLKLDKIPESLTKLCLSFVYESNFITFFAINLHNTTLKEQDISVFLNSPELIPSLYKKDELVTPNECRVLFLGNGDSGKTYTIKRLLNDCKKETKENPYTTKETPGVEIVDYTTDTTKYNKEKVTIHFWDFGGQTLLHYMHRCFLTDKTCYVVTVKTRETNSTTSARYWLKNVTAFAPNSPILLYVNCWENDDGLRSIDETRLCNDFPNIKKVVYVSAQQAEDEKFRNFANEIIEMAKDSDIFKQPVPGQWLKVRDIILKKNTDYLTKERYYEICRENGIKDNEISALLTYYNILGVCFSYHEKNTSEQFADFKLLAPNWHTNAVYSIIEEGAVEDGRISRLRIEQMLANNAPETIIKKDENGKRIKSPYKRTMPNTKYNDTECGYVIDVAAAYNLCYRIDKDELFFPALCTNNTPKEALDVSEEYDQSINYLLKYEYLPDTVIHQLMVQCLKSDITLNHAWLKGMIVGSMNQYKAIVYMQDDEKLKIEVKSKDKPAYDFFELLRADILEINERHNLKAKEFIVDGREEYAVKMLLNAAKGTNIVYSDKTDSENKATDLLGMVYDDWTLKFTEIKDGNIVIPILPKKFTKMDKSDPHLRIALYEQYHRICALCRQPLPNAREFEVDHIFPTKYKNHPELEEYVKYLESCGFDTDNPDYVENYMPAHKSCNIDKSNSVDMFSLIARHEVAYRKSKKVLELYEKYKK